MAVSPTMIDVDAVLDSAKFSGVSLMVALCAGTILVLDGLDIQLIGIAAPDIVRDLGMDRGTLAPALAAALVSMLLGAPMIGALGDRYGRRPALLLLIGVPPGGILGASFSSCADM